MLKKLTHLLIFIQYILFGLMAGLLFTLITGSAKDQGLAAGGIVVFNALIGMLLGIVMAVITSTKVKTISIPKINILLAVLNIVAASILILLINERLKI